MVQDDAEKEEGFVVELTHPSPPFHLPSFLSSSPTVESKKDLPPPTTMGSLPSSPRPDLESTSLGRST